MINVGKMIAEIRKDRGMSQAQLASKLNISKQAISNYEQGKREPDYTTLEAIGDVLNAPMSAFISREEQETALKAIYATYQTTQPPNTIQLSDIETRLVKAYRAATAPAKEIALETLENHPDRR